MNRQEFMNTLKKKLDCLPSEEKVSALNYYQEFFDDAGEENEQSVISNLGSPDDLAETILKSSGYFIESNKQQDGAAHYEFIPEPEQKNEEIPKPANPYYKHIDDKIPTSKNKSSGLSKGLIILIIIATFPIWIGFVAAAFCILIAIFSVLFALAVCLLVIPVATICAAIYFLPIYPLVTVFLIGATLLFVGVVILLFPLIKWFCKGIGYCFKGLINCIKNLFKKTEVNR